MANIIVAYDLMSPGQHYNVVERVIAELGPAVKLLNTTWYVETNFSIAEVRGHIQKSLDLNDRLLVVQAQSAIGWNINPENWNVMLARWR